MTSGIFYTTVNWVDDSYFHSVITKLYGYVLPQIINVSWVDNCLLFDWYNYFWYRYRAQPRMAHIGECFTQFVLRKVFNFKFKLTSSTYQIYATMYSIQVKTWIDILLTYDYVNVSSVRYLNLFSDLHNRTHFRE